MDDLHHLGREPAYPAGVHGAGDRAAGRSPFGTALGLAPLHALVVCIIGNMLPIPFIIVYIRRIFHWMRRRSPRLNALVDKLEKKAHLKGQKVTKYKYIGLWLFVAIPLPGTGAWTGALIAALLDMPLRKSIPSIFLGVVTAGLIMTFVTGGRGGDFRLLSAFFSAPA